MLNGATNFAYNGTAYLFGALGDSLAFRRQSGAAFGLVSVDLAEFSILYQTPLTVQFIGFAPGGSTVTNVFVTDGIIDGGNGPLEDFQTFYFDSQFANVTRVNVPGYGWSMDNLTFIIPEPSVWQLAALASAILGLRCFLKRPKPGTR